MNTIQINDTTWRIEEDGVRMFLLCGTERALLIDSGMSTRNARDVASDLTPLPVSLLNTHADMDHIGSNDQFESAYMHPDEGPQYSHSGKRAALIPVYDGDSIDLGGRPLRIIHLPGHTPGSIAVLDIRHRVLISGDPIQEHGRIFMFGAHRNMEAYISSLARLETFADQFDEIWPSHGDIPLPPAIIRRIHDGAEAVLAGKVKGRTTAFHGQNIVVYDLGFTTLLCDR